MRVSDSDLQTLRAETAQRDAYAMALGQVTIEHEMKRVEILILTRVNGENKTLMFTRLGAVTYEFDAVKAKNMQSVVRSMAVQRASGEAALRRLGLDPAKHELTIDLATGDVLELVGGAWVPVLEIA